MDSEKQIERTINGEIMCFYRLRSVSKDTKENTRIGLGIGDTVCTYTSTKEEGKPSLRIYGIIIGIQKKEGCVPDVTVRVDYSSYGSFIVTLPIQFYMYDPVKRFEYL